MLVCSLLFGIVLGVTVALAEDSDSTPREFSGNGISITLTEAFEKDEIEGYALACYSDDIACLIFTEDLSDYASVLTTDEYAEELIEVSGITATVVQKGGMSAFEYSWTDTEDGPDGMCYRYLLFIKQKGAVYAVVQFLTTCDAAAFEDLEPQFIAWAQSAEISD